MTSKSFHFACVNFTDSFSSRILSLDTNIGKTYSSVSTGFVLVTVSQQMALPAAPQGEHWGCCTSVGRTGPTLGQGGCTQAPCVGCKPPAGPWRCPGLSRNLLLWQSTVKQGGVGVHFQSSVISGVKHNSYLKHGSASHSEQCSAERSVQLFS